MRYGIRTLLAAGFALIAVAPVPPARAGSWHGKEVVSDGVRHIINPAEGIQPPATVQLEELWRIGGESDAEGELFGLIRGLAVDREGFVYVMDYQLSEVKAFSPAGEYLQTIGREGGGPGELRRPDSIFVSPTSLISVAMAYPSRIIQMTRTGDPAGTILIPEDEAGGAPVIVKAAPAGDHVVVQGIDRGGRYLGAIDDKGAETVRYYEERHSVDDSTPVYEEKSRSLSGRWAAGGDGRVYVASSFSDYEIRVYEPAGDVDRVVTRDYQRRKRTPEEKQLVYNWATVNPAAVLPGTRFEIEDYDKDIMAVYRRDDGTCWVLTSRGYYDCPKGSLGVFDVLDGDGRFLRQVTLLGEGNPFRDRYYFYGERLYVVTCFTGAVATMMGGGEGKFGSMCAEPMSVICYSLGS